METSPVLRATTRNKERKDNYITFLMPIRADGCLLIVIGKYLKSTTNQRKKNGADKNVSPRAGAASIKIKNQLMFFTP